MSSRKTTGSGTPVRVALLGASGYTGADALRLLAGHPKVEIALLSAHSHAGSPLREIHPHLASLYLPDPQQIDDIPEKSWAGIDVVFSCLPHGTGQDLLSRLAARSSPPRIIDLSADFRLQDTELYQHWYGRSHVAPGLQKQAVYGLSEFHRAEISRAQLVACPGCYPTAVLAGLLPLVQDGAIRIEDIVIDAKSGVTGAGRTIKESNLFAEVSEGIRPYAVAFHRHAPEIEQELSRAAGTDTRVSFTPHLLPMNRGELTSSYVVLSSGWSAADLRARLKEHYRDACFIRCLEDGEIPATRNVRGSNFCHIGVFADRVPGRAIVMAVLDNLVKGSSGQAVQNMNLMFGFAETDGLLALPLSP